MQTATWLAGEQGFRDFLCLSPAKANRAQPADPPARSEVEMTRGEPKESILRRYLADAVAAEESFEARLNEMSGEGDHLAARQLFAQHAEETRSQHSRLQARLEALGGSPSGLKKVMAHLVALIPKSTHIGHDDSEITTQNLVLGYTMAHEKVAMYEALASTAAAAGDLQTEQLARDIQKEERRAAEMIWRLIAPTAQESFGKISEAA